MWVNPSRLRTTLYDRVGGYFSRKWSLNGLRGDVTVANLQDACLKLVDLARARARELQVDQQVERAQQPLSAKTALPTTNPNQRVLQHQTNQCADSFSNQTDARMETIASMHIRVLMVSV